MYQQRMSQGARRSKERKSTYDTTSDTTCETVHLPFPNPGTGKLVIVAFDGEEFHRSRFAMAIVSLYFAARFPLPRFTSISVPLKKTRGLEDAPLPPALLPQAVYRARSMDGI